MKALTLLIIAMGLAIFSFYGYNQALNKNLSQTIYDRIEEAIMQQKSNLVLDINSDMDALANIAKIVARSNSYDEAFQVVRSMKENTKFDNIFLVNLNGVGYSQDYVSVDVSMRDYFKLALQGQINVGSPVISQATNLLVTPMACPIYVDNQLSAVIVGSYTVQKVQSLLLPTFGGNGRSYVITASGEMIATNIIEGSKSDEDVILKSNFFDLYETATFKDALALDTVYEHIAQRLPSYLEIEVAGAKRYNYYIPLDINDWYLVLCVDHNVVAATAMQIQKDSFYVAMAIVICFALMFIYVYLSDRRYAKGLYELAFYDKLTSLPNLEKFKQEINLILKNNPDTPFSCVVFDIRNFKYINDTFGFDMGDRVLQVVTQTAKDFFVTEQMGVHTLSRLHTDTFAVFLPVDSSKVGDRRRVKFIDVFRNAINFVEDYKVDLSLGRYLAQNGEDADIILEKANLAHARAQALPPNTFVLFSEEQRDSFKAAVTVRNRVEEAIKNHEFAVFLQPKYCLKTETLCGVEALVRWKQGDSYLSPDTFIPVLERNGMIVPLDLYIFERCCQLLKQWEKQGRNLIPISVNFSRNHLVNNDLADKLYAIAQKYQVEPRNLIVEITETATVAHQESIGKIVDHLHEHGFLVSMDDFGCGYSSLGLLKEIFVDEIKLDRSFIGDITEDERTKSIVKNVVSLACEIGISIVAEGVETEQQKEILKALNCNIGQGYLYSVPMPCELIFSSESFTLPTEDNSYEPFSDGEHVIFQRK